MNFIDCWIPFIIENNDIMCLINFITKFFCTCPFLIWYNTNILFIWKDSNMTLRRKRQSSGLGRNIVNKRSRQKYPYHHTAIPVHTIDVALLLLSKYALPYRLSQQKSVRTHTCWMIVVSAHLCYISIINKASFYSSNYWYSW